MLQVLVTVAGWALVGRAALAGDSHPTWLAPWALVSLCGVLLQLSGTHLAGRLTVDVAATVKQRLLCGALRMDLDAIRQQGSGRLLGVVAESTAVETARLSGAIASLAAVAQMIGAGVVLAMGAGGACWCSSRGARARCAPARHREAWTAERRELTGGFVENVVATGLAWYRSRPSDGISARTRRSPAMRRLRSPRCVGPTAVGATGARLAAGRLRGARVPALLAGGVDTGALAISIPLST